MTDLRIPAIDWAVRDVLLCDERPSVGQNSGRLLCGTPPWFEIYRCTDGFSLVDAYSARPAKLVLIGIQAGSSTGIDAVHLLLAMYPSATVIVYGWLQDVPALCDAVAGGACGLMLWDPDQPASRPVRAPDPISIGPGNKTGAELTEREMQVLLGMSHGRSNGEIGRELFLSEETVKTHARRLFGKLGARDRAHAVALGLRHGLLT